MTDPVKTIDTVTLGAVGSGYDFSTLGTVSIGSNGTSATDWVTGLPNTVWTSTGTGTTWTLPSNPVTINQGSKISLQGDEADINVNGKSMRAWMEQVEQRLNMLTPNPELEKEWDELRRLGERYRKLEKKCKEKAEVWKKLKSMPPPQVD